MSMERQKGDPDMDDLDKDLRAARDVAPPPGLMGRVLDDALRLQPVAAPAPEPVWRRLGAALGGWPGMGGMVAATAAGVWIGLAVPQDAGMFMQPQASVEVGAFGWALEDGQ